MYCSYKPDLFYFNWIYLTFIKQQHTKFQIKLLISGPENHRVSLEYVIRGLQVKQTFIQYYYKNYKYQYDNHVSNSSQYFNTFNCSN